MRKLQGTRKRIYDFVESKGCISFITVLILLNSITLGLETSSKAMANYGAVLIFLDKTVILIFTIELLLKLYASRFDFFKTGWNIFDFIVILVSWIPASGPLSILRALRILRVFRLFSVVPQMRKVVGALLHSIPGMMSVGAILILIFYVCSVLTTSLFGTHPNPEMQEWFGSIPASFYTLFQVMTLESWSMGIVRPTMEIFPESWLFFVPFIIVTSFAVLNLFIGIVVDAMQVAQTTTRNEDTTEIKQFTHKEILQLNKQLESIENDLKAIKEIAQQQNSKG